MKDDPRISLLKKFFFSRTDKICAMKPGDCPRPIIVKDNLEALLLAHIFGEAAPPVKVNYESKRRFGAMNDRYRLGSYVPNQEGLTPWLCIDFDGKAPTKNHPSNNHGKNNKPKSEHSAPLADPLGAALKTYNSLTDLGFTGYLECSGSGHGYHVWVFFHPMIPALKARLLGKLIVPADELLVDGSPADASSNRGIEIFPKQSTISKDGMGNMVWLPWWHKAVVHGGNLFHNVLDADNKITEIYIPEDFITHTEAQLDTVLQAHKAEEVEKKMARVAATASKGGGNHGENSIPSPHPQVKPSSTLVDQSMQEWRSRALQSLDLQRVYGQWLTGEISTPGWFQCRDPDSPTGDRSPSAGVSDGTGEAERGAFHSFRTGETISVFDFMVRYNGCLNFKEAIKTLAELSGIPLPRHELPDIPDGFLYTPIKQNNGGKNSIVQVPDLNVFCEPGEQTSKNKNEEAKQKSDDEEEELDPHTLARAFLNAFHLHGSERALGLRYLNGEFWIWTGLPKVDYGFKGKYPLIRMHELTPAYYRFISEATLRAQLAKYSEPLLKGSVTMAKVSNTLQALSGECLLDDQVTKPCWLRESRGQGPFIALANGVFDIGTWMYEGQSKLIEHHPEWFSEIVLPYPYDPDATCDDWIEFLEHILENDEERINLLQEFFGYCFYPSLRKQRFLILTGAGGNGKSVVLEALSGYVGEQNRSAVPLEKFDDKFSLYQTLGKLVNIVNEIGEFDKVAEGLLKSFTSGDPMMFEQKYRVPTTAKPTAKLIFSTNELPYFKDRTTGIWRRLIHIPFNVQVPDDKQDDGLYEELIRPELPGIFNWAMEGLRRLHLQRRFTKSRVCEQSLAQYCLDSNPARQFLLDETGQETGAVVSMQKLYQEYSFWCRSYGYRPLNERHFGREVKATHPQSMKIQRREDGKRIWYYQNVKFIGTSPNSQKEEDDELCPL